jgi:hypothetical protein
MTVTPENLADPPALEDAALGLDAYGQPHDLLSELLQSVRLSGERIVAYAPPRDAEPNWLAGALDPQIGLALSAIHRDPGHDWTVEELARACSLSRSAFAA